MRNSRLISLIAVVGALLVVGALVMVAVGSDSKASRIEEAWDKCSALPEAHMRGVVVGDTGQSLSISVKDDGYIEAMCVLLNLDMPDSVYTRIGNTRALDCTQEARWDEFESWWTYHPDSGWNMTVEDTTRKRG